MTYFQIVKNALEYLYCHTNETPVGKAGQWSWSLRGVGGGGGVKSQR